VIVGAADEAAVDLLESQAYQAVVIVLAAELPEARAGDHSCSLDRMLLTGH